MVAAEPWTERMPMKVKLELGDDVQARVEALAAQDGVSVEMYLQRLIERLTMLNQSNPAAPDQSPSTQPTRKPEMATDFDRIAVAGELSAATILGPEDFSEWERNGR